jgi:hypothetical protein
MDGSLPKGRAAKLNQDSTYMHPKYNLSSNPRVIAIGKEV